MLSSKNVGRRLRFETLEPKRLFATDLPYATHVTFLDVNGDDRITPVDALLIINELNENGGGIFDPFRPGGIRGWIDANGDGRISPIDALIVINYLNEYGGGPVPVGPVPNLPPRGFDSTFSVDESGSVYFVAPFLDPEAKPLTISVGTDRADGNLVLQSDGHTFRYDAPALSQDVFDLIAKDSGGLTATAKITISINIDPTRQHNPFARADFVGGVTNTPVDFNPLNNDTDVDGDAILLQSYSQPTHGVVSVNDHDGIFTYIPNVNFSGTDVFQYVISDGTGHTATGVVHINVRGNSAPVALSPSVEVQKNTPSSPISIGMLGTDSDHDTLTITFGTPSHGVVQADGSSFVYIPNANYVGTDSVSYVLSDGFSTINGTLSVLVNEAHFVGSTLTREEAVVAAITLSGVTVTAHTTSPYADLSPGDYGFDHILTAYDHGWIQNGIAVGVNFYHRDTTIGEAENLLRTVFGLGFDACLPIPAGDLANHIGTDDYFRMLGVAQYDHEHTGSACLSENLIAQLAENARNSVH